MPTREELLVSNCNYVKYEPLLNHLHPCSLKVHKNTMFVGAKCQSVTTLNHSHPISQFNKTSLISSALNTNHFVVRYGHGSAPASIHFCGRACATFCRTHHMSTGIYEKCQFSIHPTCVSSRGCSCNFGGEVDRILHVLNQKAQ